MKKIFFLLAAMTAMAGCAKKEAIEQPPQAVQAKIIQAQSSIDGDSARYSAVVTPDSEVQLGFRIPGYVVSLKQVRGEDGRMRAIAEGDSVAKGAVLVAIRPTEYQDKVHQASSQVEAAEAAAIKANFDFERAARLYNSQSLTKPDYDAAKAQYDATQAELRAARAATSEAQIALHDTSLVAPFNGDIVKKNVELGAFVGPGMPVFAVANTDLVKIVIGVPDISVRSLKLGQPVEVTVDAFPNRTFHARITRIASAADSTTRNFEVEVAIPNREHLLKVGMIGSLELTTDKTIEHKSSTVVPLSSIVQTADGNYGVYLVRQTGNGEIAHLQPVNIGGVDGSDIHILTGISNGDKVITSGSNLLKDGQRVEVLK